MDKSGKKISVAIVGGGLVGSLSASFFARRGYDVHLFEYRQDIRKTTDAKGRSINLAMSLRSRTSLAAVGLEDVVMSQGIPMQGRMIHPPNSMDIKSIPYDARTKQCIYSVSRKHLNEVLLTGAEKYSNVTLNFNHKLIKADLESGILTLLRNDSGALVEKHFDLIVGADGAFSTVRRFMMTQPLFDFSQTYIEHGYLELYIPPNAEGEYAMSDRHLHIWPRGEFMMIALPNADCSFTVTLFMPFVKFKLLNSSVELLAFFEAYFPDAVSLIGRERLAEDFFRAKPSTLVSIKCKPYHVSDKAVLLGDAAHAMVPFYGQGMNAGFEDCLLLDDLLTAYDDNIGLALSDFSNNRPKDAHSICDLAMYNYIEMRDLVNKKTFLFRKKVDDILFKMAPSYWVPLYNSVTFSKMKYHECIENRKWQDKILNRTMYCIIILGLLFLVMLYQNLF